MKTLFWWGLICVVLGLLSLVVEFPHAQPHTVKADSISLGPPQMEHRQMPGVVVGILIAGGLGMMVAGCRNRCI